MWFAPSLADEDSVGFAFFRSHIDINNEHETLFPSLTWSWIIAYLLMMIKVLVWSFYPNLCPIYRMLFGNNKFNKKKQRTFLPKDCCPKRRARWTKCHKKMMAKTMEKNKSCCISRIFCLPPPLPLRETNNCTSTRTPSSNPDEEEPSIEDSSSITETTPSPHDDTESSDSSITRDDSVASSPPDSSAAASLQASQSLTSPPRPTSAIQLLDLVRMQQWDAILQRKWRKRQIRFRDADGLYALHWAAAGGAPLAVVERLLMHGIVTAPDAEGSLPLHFAAHYSASRDVIAAVWQEYAAAIHHCDRYGRTPLYHAVDKNLSLSTFQRLLTNADESISYELITSPCYTPEGSSPREQAIRTPLYMIWNTVLHDKTRTRHTARHGKTWEKAVWLLQHSHHCHHPKNNVSLLSMCLQMDLYLPEPVIAMVATQTMVERSDLTVAVTTASYSLRRMLYILQILVTKERNEDGTLALAAARAGQPWDVLQRLSHRDRHALAIAFAMATPIVYQEACDPNTFQNDPLGLLRRVNKGAPSVPKRTQKPDVPNITKTSPVETVYQLLRENPGQLNT